MITEINLNEKYSIPYGNMAFIYEYSGFESLYEKCVNAEQLAKYNYEAFATSLRKIIEEFAICESGKAVYGKSIFDKNILEKHRSKFTSSIAKGEKKYVDECFNIIMSSDNKEGIDKFIKTIGGICVNSCTNSDDTLFNLIRIVSSFASRSSHSGSVPENMVPNESNCRMYLKLTWGMLAAYYNYNGKYDGGRLPFRDYYPVTKKLCQSFGIILPVGKQLFVRKANSETEFYIFTSDDEKFGPTQKRDIDTIYKLWMENIETPQNILENSISVSNVNGTDQRYHISKLPSFPQSLTDEYINSLSIDEKLSVVKGITKGIISMHTADIPFYHRSICALDFVVCNIRNKLKPILISFDSAKDTDNNVAYTVLASLDEKISKTNLGDLIFAPEVRDKNFEYSDYDWEKVDIYALGKTIIKVMTGSYAASPEECDGLTNEQISVLSRMILDDFKLRASTSDIENIF